MTIQGPHLYKHGKAFFSFFNLDKGKEPVSIDGCISQATFNWFAFSRGARNIATGQFNSADDKPSGVETDYETEHFIYAPRPKFGARPELIIGLSSIEISYHRAPHPMYLYTTYKKPTTKKYKIPYANEEYWHFSAITVCCHHDCFPRLEFAWVAVASDELAGDMPMRDIPGDWHKLKEWQANTAPSQELDMPKEFKAVVEVVESKEEEAKEEEEEEFNSCAKLPGPGRCHLM